MASRAVRAVTGAGTPGALDEWQMNDQESDFSEVP
jgi:hypothetical protein